MDILRSAGIWFVGIILIIVLFPVTLLVWLLTFPFDPARRITHAMLVFQGMVLAYAVPVWRIKMEGRKKADRKTTYVIISNHQSILDILLLNSLRYRYKWISKIENTKVPFVGWYLKMADYITVDRGNSESKDKMMTEALAVLKKGISLMIFPEGTRSPDSRIGFFKRGAFQLALTAGVPILPVLIEGTGGVLPKHGLIFGGFHRITIRVLDPVPPESFGTEDCDELAARFQIMMTDALSDLRVEKARL
ncbi:MAG TPA: lysophospholipid acyltransferase family protein [Bacteroidales bacterium]|nr:lysophospholipid acyltransferase family protein [Bacteroidales bacterium]HPF03017.1 lysophospholipid acyltransferase family protein [Bacteroidales bacterium]HPJ59958.1 lysophospholipid acyltransferase family protein [Bacteroidales bacterium]HPR13077.1 lysophospholipid acyltransferase family protein [Bacteroidales bacterium]HRW85697.1 lysophospholipid acyltransferase family protein [Bacteroidales bacterium]